MSLWLSMFPAIASGQSIAAVWEPNPSEDAVTSYEVCLSTTPLSCNVQRATVPATQSSYDFAPTPGVLYRVAVRAINAAAAGAFSPEVVASIPSLVQPPDQTSTVNAAISPLSLSASDPDGSALRFTHIGLPFGLSLNSATGITTGTPTSSGTFNVTVFASDSLQTTSRSFVWTIRPGASSDTSAPALSVTSHTSGQTVTTSSITLAGTASDSSSGGSGISSVTVDGAIATGGTASGSNTANWSRSVPLSTGSSTLTVVATDGAGNRRTSSLTINRTSADTTVPTLTITSHTSNQVLSTTTITMSGTATDNATGGSGIRSVTLNGSPASGGTASGTNTAYWNWTLTLAGGPNVITVAATDGAGNVRTTPITLVAPTPVAPMTSAGLTANLTSPRTPGTTVTLTGQGSGGTAPYSFKWWVQKDGGAWTLLQDWTASPVTWTPTQSGNYVVGVWGRSSGATADLAQGVGTLPFMVTAATSTPPAAAPPPPSSGTAMTLASLSASVSSPRTTGTAVTFTASGNGGLSPYAFKWWVQKDGGIWTMVQDWSTSATWTWTPAQAGNYAIGVWGRSADNSVDRPQAIATAPYVITATTAWASSVVPPSAIITSSVPSPRTVATTVTFSTSVTGGTAPYSFKYWIQKDGGSWTLVRDWSTDATLNWTPAQSGTYAIGVWVRNAGAILDIAQTIATAPFAISSGTSMTGSSLVANVSTARVGASVTLTAGGTGGAAPYSFRWWVQKDGGAWTDMSGWSASQGYTWTPSMPGSYVIAIWGRSAGATADAPQSIASTSVVILP
jgi:hypothetical protein